MLDSSLPLLAQTRVRAGTRPEGVTRGPPRVRALRHGGGDRSATLVTLSESLRDTAVMRYLGKLLRQWRTAINSRATVVDRRRDGAERHAR
jgi:hypothetical protein